MAEASEFVRHGGLLVPADSFDELSGKAVELRKHLAAERALQAVQREDVRVRRATSVQHELALAAVDEQESAARRSRRERTRDAVETDELSALYRRAANSGTRARIRAQIQGSAEMRALRVAKVRTVTLLAGIPVLAAFAAWSTTGVQAGVVRLLVLDDRSAAWWAAWAMEPALIAIVALIIIGRAVLRSSGGDTDGRATAAEWTALGLSLALNIVGGWDGVATALPHAIGPLGCAGTAFLIGLFDSYVTDARPWDDAPRLHELGLVATNDAPAPNSAAVAAVLPTPETVAAPVIEAEPAPAPVANKTPVEPAAQAAAPVKRPARPKVTTAERVARHLAKNPDATQEQVAARLKVTVRTVQRYWPSREATVTALPTAA